MLLIYHFVADVLPAPVNVQLRRISSTAFEVTWDAARYPGVTGYRVYYQQALPRLPPPGEQSSPVDDTDGWTSVEIGPFTSAEISGLEPAAVYAVKVRAKGVDGRYGNMSNAIWTRRRDQGQYRLLLE